MAVHVPRGRYADELVPGDVYRHEPGRTITESDNSLFCHLTMNRQPLHLDAEKAAETEFGGRIVNAMLTVAILASIGTPELTLNTAVVNLAMGESTFPRPLLLGDTLYSETEVVAVRPSGSRPGMSVVELEHRGHNQRGELVATARRTLLMLNRPAEVVPAAAEMTTPS